MKYTPKKVSGTKKVWVEAGVRHGPSVTTKDTHSPKPLSMGAPVVKIRAHRRTLPETAKANYVKCAKV